MKHLRLLSSVALVSLLAACGGGGGGMTPGPTVSSAGSGNGGSTSTTTPTGSNSGGDGGSTSTTTPPQAGPANTMAGYTVVDQSDAGKVVDQSNTPATSSEATVTVDTSTQTPTVTISTPKDPTGHQPDTVTPTDASHFFQSAGDWGNAKNSNYPNGYATIASSGKLTSPSDGLQYSDYGLWQSLVSTPGGSTGVMRGAYATGEQTLAANMPKTGTASYAGSFQGLATIPGGNGNTPYGVIGTVGATANFGPETMDITITPTQATSLHPGVTPPSMAGSTIGISGAPISGSTYSGGTVTGNIAGIPIASGSSVGQFNGPQANEISGIVSAAGASGSGMNITGSYGAAQH